MSGLIEYFTRVPDYDLAFPTGATCFDAIKVGAQQMSMAVDPFRGHIEEICSFLDKPFLPLIGHIASYCAIVLCAISRCCIEIIYSLGSIFIDIITLKKNLPARVSFFAGIIMIDLLHLFMRPYLVCIHIYVIVQMITLSILSGIIYIFLVLPLYILSSLGWKIANSYKIVLDRGCEWLEKRDWKILGRALSLQRKVISTITDIFCFFSLFTRGMLEIIHEMISLEAQSVAYFSTINVYGSANEDYPIKGFIHKRQASF